MVTLVDELLLLLELQRLAILVPVDDVTDDDEPLATVAVVATAAVDAFVQFKFEFKFTLADAPVVADGEAVEVDDDDAEAVDDDEHLGARDELEEEIDDRVILEGFFIETKLLLNLDIMSSLRDIVSW